MKRKKKDLNQHSWKVHILQFLTVGFALCILVGDCRRSEIDAEITSGSDREVDGSTFDHRFFRECLAWDNAGKKKEAPALYFCGFLSCTSDICGGFDVFPGSERMLASDDCSRIVCDSAYIDVL